MPRNMYCSLYLKSKINPDNPVPEILEPKNLNPGDVVLHKSGAVAIITDSEDPGELHVVMFTPLDGVYPDVIPYSELARVLGAPDVELRWCEIADDPGHYL